MVNRSSHRANWIRLRLLSGTSSLNLSMHRITGGHRPPTCPVCRDGDETVLHFLQHCSSAFARSARSAHRARVTHKFGDLSDIQKCAFILGCTVSCGVTATSANLVEDLANRQLVEGLWENRCAALEADAALELTYTENVRRGRPKRGVRGVEAHGIATLSN